MNYEEKMVVDGVRKEFMSLEELLNYINKNKWKFIVNKTYKEYEGNNEVEYDVDKKEIKFHFKTGIKTNVEFEVEVPNKVVIDFYDDYNLSYSYINEEGYLVNKTEETSIFKVDDKYGHNVLSIYLVDKNNKFLTILYHKDEY